MLAIGIINIFSMSLVLLPTVNPYSYTPLDQLNPTNALEVDL